MRAEEASLRHDREGLEDCYAWMLDSPRPLPTDDHVEEVAACYEVVARAAELIQELEAEGALFPVPAPDLLFLLAEAQSSLLTALSRCDLRGDSDQRDLFLWLKEQTTRHRVYVDRHMRLDDPADSSKVADLLVRLEKTVREIRDARSLGAEREFLRGRRVLVLSNGKGTDEGVGMKAELGLGGMTWVSLDTTPDLDEALTREIGRKDVELVVLAARIPEPSYARFKNLCAEGEKLFVRLALEGEEVLTGGRLLKEVERQVGERIPGA